MVKCDRFMDKHWVDLPQCKAGGGDVEIFSGEIRLGLSVKVIFECMWWECEPNKFLVESSSRREGSVQRAWYRIMPRIFKGISTSSVGLNKKETERRYEERSLWKVRERMGAKHSVLLRYLTTERQYIVIVKTQTLEKDLLSSKLKQPLLAGG